MTQVKKDTIKNSIVDSALNLFSQKGYLNTSMKDIAEDANISVGNIYIYFENKDNLFYSLVNESIIKNLKNKLIYRTYVLNQKNSNRTKDNKELFFEDEDIESLIKYRKQILMIYEHNEGTKFENSKENLIESIMEVKKKFIKTEHERYSLSFDDIVELYKIILNNFVCMVTCVLKKNISEKEMEEMLKAIDIYRLYGITGLND